jgi:DNA repair exonuclease SbcCD ATPase subunit
MKILKLTAENIKKLVAVEITPEGNVIKITGKNGAGKTSVLDVIQFALGGLSNIQSQPIRKGQAKAKAELDLGEFIVRRTFTIGGSSLIVENKEGARYGSPQAMLDAILGKLCFDPLAFMRLDAKVQFDTLKSLTGVDTTDIETKRKTAFDERTAVNRDLKAVEARYNAIAVPLDVPEKELSSAEITAKITAVSELKSKRDLAVERNKQFAESLEREKQKVQDFTQQISHGELAITQYESDRKQLNADIKLEVGDIASLRAELAKIQKQIETAINNKARKDSAIEEDKSLCEDIENAHLDITNVKKDILTAEAGIKSLQEKRDAIKPELSITVPDTNALQVEFANVDVRNKAFRLKQDKDKLKVELDTTKQKSENLSADIEKLDTEKLSRVASAKFPVAGLTFGEGFVTYNDLPLEQASDAEKLRVSMAMAMAMNPKLKVLRITDGSLLDSNSMKIIEEMAKDKDYQVWIEMVDESGKIGIVIEDGAVIKNNELFNNEQKEEKK